MKKISERDKRLMQNKKRISKQYDILFEKIVEILVKYRLEVKDFNISELKKYNRLTKFNNQIKELLKNFNDDEMVIVEEILQEEFKASWKEQQKAVHKRVKMPKKEEINKITNHRNNKDGLSVKERNKRNNEYLQYKIYSAVVKNAINDNDFDKLINEDIEQVKEKFVNKTALRQAQDDITQAECLGVIFLGATLNGNYREMYDKYVDAKTDEPIDEVKKTNKYVMVYTTAGDDRVCEVCEGYAGTEFEIGEISIPEDSHPNCRCYFILKEKEL